MADAKDTHRPDSPVSPIHAAEVGRAESPTTAQPLDFDDEDPNTPIGSRPNPMEHSKPVVPPKDAKPIPAKPAHLMSAREQAEATLREAFPTIDPTVVKAVLSASKGQLDPAFNALLEMTDPDAAEREPEVPVTPVTPPVKPPRPIMKPAIQTTTAQSQLDADEQYARQLAEQYDAVPEQPQVQRRDRYNENLPGSRVGRPGAHPNPDDYHWRSFVDDDLPEIRDNIKKGFLDTQKTVNSWINNFKKNFEAPEDDDYTAASSQQPPPKPPRRNMDAARTSQEYNRYDADPQLIGDDFSKLDLQDGQHPPRTTSRPLANPNLLKNTPDKRRQSPASGRKVSFREGPPEEIQDMYSSGKTASPKVNTVSSTPGSGAKTSKWQPLSTVTPSPITDNDPFSLGDSDDEKDAKPITMNDLDEETSASKTAAKPREEVKDAPAPGVTGEKKSAAEDEK